MLTALARPTCAFLAISLLSLSSCGGAAKPSAESANDATATANSPKPAAGGRDSTVPESAASEPGAQADTALGPESPAASASQQSKVIPTDVGVRDQDTLPASQARPAEATPAPLPSGTLVLHVGDSFAGALGLPLNHRLKAAGLRSVLEFETASYIPGWASGDKLRRYIGRYNPDLVLITLGANELEIVNPEQRIKNIRKIVATIGDRPCVWVATPLWDGAKNGLFEIIRQNIAPCLYMDTNALISSMPRVADGIHPTLPAREDWADVVVEWLRTHRQPTAEKPWALAP